MRPFATLCLALCASCGPLYLRSQVIEFRSDSALTTKSGTWHAVEAADAPSPPLVWMQQGTSAEAQFNLAMCEDGTPHNGEARVLLRAVEGAIDQGGGIVWRALDERNYYLARWNPLEGNLRAYKVIEGTRTQLFERPVKAGAGWHRLRVWFSGPAVEIWFDGQSLGEYSDASLTRPGTVGLWTKADAQTQFDNLEIVEF